MQSCANVHSWITVLLGHSWFIFDITNAASSYTIFIVQQRIFSSVPLLINIVSPTSIFLLLFIFTVRWIRRWIRGTTRWIRGCCIWKKYQPDDEILFYNDQPLNKNKNYCFFFNFIYLNLKVKTRCVGTTRMSPPVSWPKNIQPEWISKLICNLSLYILIPKIKSISPSIAKKSGDN